MLSSCFLDFFYGCMDVCHRTESDLFLFVLHTKCINLYAYILYIFSNMFQNGQPTFLLWHNIQAYLPISIV